MKRGGDPDTGKEKSMKYHTLASHGNWAAAHMDSETYQNAA